MMGAIRTLHAWAGTALAVLAVVFGLTGTLLVFEDDWVRATVPAARAEVDLDSARLGAALDRLETAEPGLTSVVLPDGAVGVHRLYLADEGFGYADADGAVVDLSTGEYDLLLTFLEHPQRVLSRDHLMDVAKNRVASGFDRAIDIQVSRLRKKLDSHGGPEMVKTVRGAGYLFAPQVERS